MLIIKISSEKTENKKFFLKHRRKTEVNRRNIFIENNIHTLLECSEGFCASEDFERLLNIYKGKILLPEKTILKKTYERYLFDTKPYLKRAVLSALIGYIYRNFYFDNTLCVIDDKFVFTKEYLELARKVRNIVIVAQINLEAQKFMDYCYLNLGTFVRFKENMRDAKWDLYIDLSDVSDEGNVHIRCNDSESILHPDSEYFVCKNEFKELLSWGISPIDLCAAMEVQRDYEVEWNNNKV